ncbi:unnamed protein product [Closterium sp. NIES-64]|nr:unnamed protein product [Closterium sp. NIES-64]
MCEQLTISYVPKADNRALMRSFGFSITHVRAHHSRACPSLTCVPITHNPWEQVTLAHATPAAPPSLTSSSPSTSTAPFTPPSHHIHRDSFLSAFDLIATDDDYDYNLERVTTPHSCSQKGVGDSPLRAAPLWTWRWCRHCVACSLACTPQSSPPPCSSLTPQSSPPPYSSLTPQSSPPPYSSLTPQPPAGDSPPDPFVDGALVAALRCLPTWTNGDVPAVPSEELQAVRWLQQRCWEQLGAFPTTLQQDEAVLGELGEEEGSLFFFRGTENTSARWRWWPAISSTLTAHCSQLTALSSLLSAHCSQLTALSSLLSAHCSQLTALSSLLSARCSQLTALSSLLSAHCSQLTALSSLLSAHCSPIRSRPLASSLLPRGLL